jgi:hypothetical protein
MGNEPTSQEDSETWEQQFKIGQTECLYWTVQPSLVMANMATSSHVLKGQPHTAGQGRSIRQQAIWYWRNTIPPWSKRRGNSTQLQLRIQVHLLLNSIIDPYGPGDTCYSFLASSLGILHRQPDEVWVLNDIGNGSDNFISDKLVHKLASKDDDSWVQWWLWNIYG